MRKRLSFLGRLTLMFLFILLVILPLVLNGRTKSSDLELSVSYSTEGFIEELAPEAVLLGEAYGIRPSILLAQALFETKLGTSLLGARYHNLYELPATEGQTQVLLTTPLVKQDKETVVTRSYQVYGNWASSMRDYLARLQAAQLGSANLYPELVTAKGYWEASQAFYRNGFTEDQTYGDQLLRLISTYKLDQYDKN